MIITENMLAMLLGSIIHKQCLASFLDFLSRFHSQISCLPLTLQYSIPPSQWGLVVEHISGVLQLVEDIVDTRIVQECGGGFASAICLT